MLPNTIGFIGFGEVSSVFSKAMRKHSANILVYDILLEQDDKMDTMKKKIREAGSDFDTLDHVIKNSRIILSAVITQEAKNVAEACSRFLGKSQIYVDLNSTSPTVKKDIGRIIMVTGSEFVEGAILGAVGATGPKTRILTAGAKGREVADTLNSYGLNASYYSPLIGQASTFKMLRSTFSKGLESLILELLVAGKRAGMEKDLWNDITDFMSQKPFTLIASNWVQTHAVACQRRYHEMLQVVETMKGMEIDPIMASSTLAFFRRSCAMGFEQSFPEKPDSFETVVDFMERELKHAEPRPG